MLLIRKISLHFFIIREEMNVAKCSQSACSNFLLRHFYAIFAWSYIEEYELIIWLVVRKIAKYQAIYGFYGVVISYEKRSISYDTEFHIFSPDQSY